MSRFIFVVMGLSVLAASAQAQRRVQYDTVSASTPAAVSCGFCSGEKFGVVFRPLDGGRGLRADEFPLTLNTIETAVARTTVTGDIFSGGYMCQGSTEGGRVSMMIEAYAGTTVPVGSIDSYPATGPWPGESMVFAESAELEVSVETAAGSRMYNVMVNRVMLSPAVRIEPPNTYIRVVVTIPSGGSSTSCSDLGLTPPLAVAVRDDDGRIANNTGFIYSAGGIGDGWIWNEDERIQDPVTFTTGINGDWLIRLDVTPIPTATDGGMPMPDAGTDAGMVTTMDSGPPPTPDAGSTAMCSADGDCAGGERCVEGECRRVSCTAASDCAGGMTCVDGMCRNLCSSNAECLGGEVCDSAAGHCVPVSMTSGGCGCRAASNGPHGAAMLGIVGVLLVITRRRWRRSSRAHEPRALRTR